MWYRSVVVIYLSGPLPHFKGRGRGRGLSQYFVLEKRGRGVVEV